MDCAIVFLVPENMEIRTKIKSVALLELELWSIMALESFALRAKIADGDWNIEMWSSLKSSLTS